MSEKIDWEKKYKDLLHDNVIFLKSVKSRVDNIEKYILKIPIIRLLIIIPQKIYLPKFKGLTLYDLLKTYFFGIIEGTFSSRAGSIAFSFFMALFPFILFLLN